MASLPKIDSPTRQPIPFAPTVLRPPRFRMALASGLATLQHAYHNDSTATIPAAASSSSLAFAHNSESADGVAYRGLTAFASLSLAVSAGQKARYSLKTIRMPIFVCSHVNKNTPEFQLVVELESSSEFYLLTS